MKKAMNTTTTQTTTTNTNTTTKGETTMNREQRNAFIEATKMIIDEHSNNLFELTEKEQLTKEDFEEISKLSANIARLMTECEKVMAENAMEDEVAATTTKEDTKKLDSVIDDIINNMNFRELQAYAKEKNLPVKRGGKGVNTETLRASIKKALVDQMNNATTKEEKKEEKKAATKATKAATKKEEEVKEEVKKVKEEVKKEEVKATTNTTKSEKTTTTATAGKATKGIDVVMSKLADSANEKLQFTFTTTVEEFHARAMSLEYREVLAWARDARYGNIDREELPPTSDKVKLIRDLETILFGEYYNGNANEALHLA